MTVNDGKGLYDSGGMIDTLIVDCDALVRDLAGGGYVAFCARIVDMVQKLSRLKDGIGEDRKILEERIRELEEAAAEHVQD